MQNKDIVLYEIGDIYSIVKFGMLHELSFIYLRFLFF
jgi:hypothetical protein